MGQEQWLGIMVRAAGRLGSAPFGIAVVDPGSGSIAYHNAAMQRLVASPIPATVQAVDRRGLVPPDAREELRSAATADDGHDSCATLEVPVNRPGSRTVTVHLLHLHAFRGEGHVVAVVATDFDNTFHVDDLEQTPDPPLPLGFAYDLDGVCIAADERLVEYGLDPANQIGGHSMLMSHPVDVPRISTIVRPVYLGTTASATYGVRAVGPAGAWTNLTCEIHRLEGSPPLVIAGLTPGDPFQPSVDVSRLTPREIAVVVALFDGKRPAQIAAEGQVAVGTVRNQVASVLRKLGVSGQAELLTRFTRPAGR